MNRRNALRNYSLALIGCSLPGWAHAQYRPSEHWSTSDPQLPKHFPNIDPEIIAEVVGKSHFDLERVRELVDKRPELAQSVWEWRFGDFESAIGAASHVGRRDIALYLIQKGARPTLFTYAMLGAVDIIKSAITLTPGIQQRTGPHGISLLDHAYAGQRMKDQMSASERESLQQTISYLESLGDAGGPTYMDVSPEAQQKYVGDYKYGTGDQDGFTIGVNMRKLLSLGPIGGFGGALYKIDDDTFIYNGAPSVRIRFEMEKDTVKSLTLTEPDLKVVAKKVS